MPDLTDALTAALHDAIRREYPGARGPRSIEWRFLTDAERAYEFPPVVRAVTDPAFREALTVGIAAGLPNVMGQGLTNELYEPGTSWLDVPDEWYDTPRNIATAIVAHLLPEGK